MAIAAVKKIHILAHRSEKVELVAALQKLGAVEISQARNVPVEKDRAEAKELETPLRRIGQALRTLRPYLPSPTFLEKIYPPHPRVTGEDLRRVVDDFDLDGFLSSCENIGRELEDLKAGLSRLEEEKRTLAPWVSLDAPPALLRSTRLVELVIGRIPADRRPAFQAALDDAGADMNRVWEGDRFVYAVVICLTACDSQIRAIMKKHGFQELQLPGLDVSPRERIAQIDEERRATEARVAELRESYRALAASSGDLLLLRDVLENRLARVRAEHMMDSTWKTVSIEGWVPSGRLPEVRKNLSDRFPLVSIRDYEPGPLDAVPVILENPPPVRPFGLVVDLYGLPRYGAIDPSAVLAAFFALFFGLCLTDAGYGIFIAALTGGILVFAPRPLPPGRRRFLQMFCLCGVVTSFVGAAAGGWFGVAAPWRFFDPLEDLMLFFVLVLIVGTLHLFAGLALRMIRLAKEGKLFGAIVDQGFWMLLILSLYGLGAGEAELLPQRYLPLFRAVSVTTALGIVFFQGRSERERTSRRGEFAGHLLWAGSAISVAGWIMGAARPWSLAAALVLLAVELFFLRGSLKRTLSRLGLGLYALYGITGYLSDILSYSRLVALGLGTGIVALVVNKMSAVALEMPVLGYVLAPVVLVAGHLFNIMINLLGAFVHSCRLQYVEFFTKFYESGGKPFSPFQLVGRCGTVEEGT